jgi:hypothetical protein
MIRNAISEPCDGTIGTESCLAFLKARLGALGMTRKILSRTTGISYFRIQSICGGYGNPGNASKRLIEVAVGMPIWSTQEEFRALTQFLTHASPAITAEKSNQKTEK